MGRAVNILDKDQSTVTEVEFIDQDHDTFTIKSSSGSYLKLVFSDGDNEMVFSRADLDNFIKLFEAAKQYNI